MKVWIAFNWFSTVSNEGRSINYISPVGTITTEFLSDYSLLGSDTLQSC